MYNTYQMYLKDSAARLRADAELLEKNGLWLGVKVLIPQFLLAFILMRSLVCSRCLYC